MAPWGESLTERKRGELGVGGDGAAHAGHRGLAAGGLAAVEDEVLETGRPEIQRGQPPEARGRLEAAEGEMRLERAALGGKTALDGRRLARRLQHLARARDRDAGPEHARLRRRGRERAQAGDRRVE